MHGKSIITCGCKLNTCSNTIMAYRVYLLIILMKVEYLRSFSKVLRSQSQSCFNTSDVFDFDVRNLTCVSFLHTGYANVLRHVLVIDSLDYILVITNFIDITLAWANLHKIIIILKYLFNITMINLNLFCNMPWAR